MPSGPPAPFRFVDPLHRPLSYGPFTTRSVLGEGGMGVVYAAEHRHTGEHVALKVLHPAFSLRIEAPQRFLREWNIASTLSHPHLVRHFESGQHEGQLYLSVELLTGGDGEQWVERGARMLDEREVARVGRDLANALDDVHRSGFIHRDIKPSNILFAADGTVKLGDFGCVRSKINQEALTLDGTILGTPDYMAPEQARGQRDIDERVDIYALGATLYFLATGQTPFRGSSVWDIIGQVVNGAFPDPRVLRPRIDPGLRMVIHKACATQRDRRYADAKAFAADCQRVMAGETVPARPEPIRAPRIRSEEPDVFTTAEVERSTVLIVDDDPVISRIYDRRLREDGYEVCVAATGMSALHAIEVIHPDLILLDLHLPDMDGLDVLKRMRALALPQRTPVIVLSNAFNLDHVSQALEAGADGVLAKSRTTPREVSDATRNLILSGRVGVSTRHQSLFDEVGIDELKSVTTVPLSRLEASALGLRTLSEAGFRLAAREIADTCHGLSAIAGAAGVTTVATIAAADEMLIRHLIEHPQHVGASTYQTIIDSIAVMKGLLSVLETMKVLPSVEALHALVVDDDPIITRLAGAALKRLGFVVTVVNDSADALSHITSKKFDIAILDIVMPGLDGAQLAAAVRSDPVNSDIPIIFITAMSTTQYATPTIAGTVDRIGKPFPMMEMVTKALIVLCQPSICSMEA